MTTTKGKVSKWDIARRKLLSVARYHEEYSQMLSGAIGGYPTASRIRKHREWAKVCRDAAWLATYRKLGEGD